MFDAYDKRGQQGFSLIEIALVLIIIGVIITGIGIARDAKRDADMTKLYKTIVEPCIAAAGRGKAPMVAITECSIGANGATIDHANGSELRTMAAESVTSDFTVGTTSEGTIGVQFTVSRF